MRGAHRLDSGDQTSSPHARVLAAAARLAVRRHRQAPVGVAELVHHPADVVAGLDEVAGGSALAGVRAERLGERLRQLALVGRLGGRAMVGLRMRWRTLSFVRRLPFAVGTR
jgi:hypothetical protein